MIGMGSFRKKVMWVDDEIEMLRAHIMFLETRGYTVVPVFTGDDAVELVRAGPREFDIILLDEQMPGKDGLSTLVEIKAMRPDLPVVMVTKSEEENLMEIALGKKIDGYLTKPVNPSQILLVCKRLLDAKQFIASEVKQQFLRSYSESAALLRGRLSALQWASLHETISREDTELDKIEDEGLRQTHAGQKSDANAAFAEFVGEHYGRWTRCEDAPPVLSTGVFEKFVDPLFAAGDQVYCIIVSGMRLDQYLGIEETVRALWKVQRHYFYSILPSDTLFARTALLAGAFPRDLAGDSAELREGGPQEEERLLVRRLTRAKINCTGQPRCLHLTEDEAFQSDLKGCDKSQLVVIVTDFVNLLTGGSASSAPTALAQEIAPGERALRSMTRTWFENSALRSLLTALSRKKCPVVLTSDHGTVYCTRKTEVYGINTIDLGLRYRFLKSIAVDERRVLVMDDPRRFGLPRNRKTPSCIIAKEDYYLAPPENFSESHQKGRNAFQQGGISMDEMIMPLAVLTPL
jgi:CheY-like chemotaxis protein